MPNYQKWKIVMLKLFETIMPGKSYSDPLPDLTENEIEIKNRMGRHIDFIAGKIGSGIFGIIQLS
jgi:hypothetical protein